MDQSSRTARRRAARLLQQKRLVRTVIAFVAAAGLLVNTLGPINVDYGPNGGSTNLARIVPALVWALVAFCLG